MFKQLSRLATVATGASLMAFATLAFVTGSLSIPATAYAHHCKGGHANDPGCEPSLTMVPRQTSEISSSGVTNSPGFRTM